jgi:hypothetical protein
MTTDNFCFYLQYRLIQTSQTGGQQYSNTSPFSIPCSRQNVSRSSGFRPNDVDCLFVEAILKVAAASRVDLFEKRLAIPRLPSIEHLPLFALLSRADVVKLFSFVNRQVK